MNITRQTRNEIRTRLLEDLDQLIAQRRRSEWDLAAAIDERLLLLGFDTSPFLGDDSPGNLATGTPDELLELRDAVSETT